MPMFLGQHHPGGSWPRAHRSRYGLDDLAAHGPPCTIAERLSGPLSRTECPADRLGTDAGAHSEVAPATRPCAASRRSGCPTSQGVALVGTHLQAILSSGFRCATARAAGPAAPRGALGGVWRVPREAMTLAAALIRRGSPTRSQATSFIARFAASLILALRSMIAASNIRMVPLR
jgi:hypothetical protein